ncbi:MAG: acetyl-CoA decarbonylase/synthase complex subunit gamma [Candidatus Omnitrophica bacterium]|nr:acetyl-CoA decarbonylase/synthase complex subunit gamma [Candidatus Omnitrophota bacterium]
MALSGLDIYKLLPKTNCRQCGFATCLAFAMQLAKKAVPLDKCPFLSDDAKRVLEASSQPAIRQVVVGTGEASLSVGNETVLFRHEEKFHRPCGIGFILDDTLSDAEIVSRLEKISRMQFERVGQVLQVNLVAVRSGSGAQRFAQVVKLAMDKSSLALVLMSDDPQSLKAGLAVAASRRPLVYHADEKNASQIASLCLEFKCPLVVTAPDIEGLTRLTALFEEKGLSDIFLEPGPKPVGDQLWDITQIRRQALKKNNRRLGFPVLVIAEDDDPCREAVRAATWIAKYAGIVLIKNADPAEALALLTLRQNIYTDPQKPLQIEPKLYGIGQASEKSPVLVTTNFSLSYYTVLGEVEASKVPAYILSVDTEGMSVLTAWAAEKFTPEKIVQAMEKASLGSAVSHKTIVIPGYVAVMSGDLQEACGWQVTVGPKEAAGLPSFLKNLS